jgi:hypothetical protein
VEERVTALEELPGRLDRLGTQILDMRTEMREEFSAIRGEPRGPDTPSLASVRDEMREEFSGIREEFSAIRGEPRGPDTPSLVSLRDEMREEFSAIRGEPRGPDTPSLVSLRDAIQENGERIMTQVRVLHEDLVVRIAALGEPSKRKRRR